VASIDRSWPTPAAAAPICNAELIAALHEAVVDTEETLGLGLSYVRSSVNCCR